MDDNGNSENTDDEVAAADAAYRSVAEQERERRIKQFEAVLLGEGPADNKSQSPDGMGGAPFLAGHGFPSDKEPSDEMRSHAGHRLRMRAGYSERGDEYFDGVDDIDLLELLLSYIVPRKDVRPLADGMIKAYGSLYGVLTAPRAELAAFPSMTESAAEVLSLFTKKFDVHGTGEIKFKGRADTVGFFGAAAIGDRRAGTHVVYTDSKYLPITIESYYGENIATVSSIVSGAYKHVASGVIVCRRNDGILPDAQSGEIDIINLRAALNGMGVALLDVLIFTDIGYYMLGTVANDVDSFLMYTFVPLVSAVEPEELCDKLIAVID